MGIGLPSVWHIDTRASTAPAFPRQISGLGCLSRMTEAKFNTIESISMLPQTARQFGYLTLRTKKISESSERLFRRGPANIQELFAQTESTFVAPEECGILKLRSYIRDVDCDPDRDTRW
jgi:hypothetical protein